MQRLSTIREALLSELSGNEAQLRFINTRLILSVGVSLFVETRGEDIDQRRVEAVLATLRKMGFLKEQGTEGSRG